MFWILVMLYVIVTSICNFAEGVANIVGYEHWVRRSWIEKLNALGLLFIALCVVTVGLAFVVPLALVSLIWLATLAFHLWTRFEYNSEQREKRRYKEWMLAQEEEKRAHRQRYMQFMELWTKRLPAIYYREDVMKLLVWLESSNLIDRFCQEWDDYDRLYVLDLHIKRKSICHLEHLDQIERDLRGRLRWKREQERRRITKATEQPKVTDGIHV